MNCKPGDLAIVVDSQPNKRETLGRIVEVGRICPNYPGSWVIKFLGSVPSCMRPNSNYSAPDSCLKPVSGLPRSIGDWQEEEDTKKEEKLKHMRLGAGGKIIYE